MQAEGSAATMTATGAGTRGRRRAAAVPPPVSPPAASGGAGEPGSGQPSKKRRKERYAGNAGTTSAAAAAAAAAAAGDEAALAGPNGGAELVSPLSPAGALEGSRQRTGDHLMEAVVKVFTIHSEPNFSLVRRFGVWAGAWVGWAVEGCMIRIECLTSACPHLHPPPYAALAAQAAVLQQRLWVCHRGAPPADQRALR